MTTDSPKNNRTLYIILGVLSAICILLPVFVYTVLTNGVSPMYIPLAAIMPGYLFYKAFSQTASRTSSDTNPMPPSLTQKLLVLSGMLLIGCSFFININPIRGVVFAAGIIILLTWLYITYRK